MNIIQRYEDGERGFCGADLHEANLRGANLCWADLRGADLREAKYSPVALLTNIYIGDVSTTLTAELMKWDAELRVFGGASFALWAKGNGPCPFNGNETRAFHFSECRGAFEYGPPRMRFPELFRAVMRELNITIEEE